MRLLVAIGLVLSGCAVSDPGASSKFVGLALMGFHVRDAGPKAFLLVASGAGAHNTDQVQAGFDAKAHELCDGGDFSQDAETRPYSYGSQGGGMYFKHSAFRRSGKIVCK